MIGARMKIAMMIDMIRAMARPLYSSRTMATETTRGAAAPRPWRKRAATISHQFPASIDSTHPATNSAYPQMITLLRP